jgi:hypothetical protein
MDAPSLAGEPLPHIAAAVPQSRWPRKSFKRPPRPKRPGLLFIAVEDVQSARADLAACEKVCSMTWRPRPENEGQGHDHRLDPYRERGAILTSPGDRSATLFVRMETYWHHIGGHLWWRQWSEPFEVPHGYMVFAVGGFDDWLVGREGLDEELRDWAQNRLRYVGEVLDIEWLDDAASRHVRDAVLGLDAP